VRTIRLTKGAEGVLLGSWTVVLLFVTMLLQGGSGVRTNLAPFEDVMRLAYRASRGGVLSNAFLYALIGIAGNLVIFAIWAFLAWKFLDGPGRTAARNHLDVALAGTLFSVGIETVQLFLPTRAADVNDVFWNVLGTLVGSALAHAHRDVRVAWE
jgi:glycopeptide antibiotics resistance protein